MFGLELGVDEVIKGNIWKYKYIMSYEHIVDVEAFTRYLTAYRWHVSAKTRVRLEQGSPSIIESQQVEIYSVIDCSS